MMRETPIRSEIKAKGGKNAFGRALLHELSKLRLVFRASGYKSSEGDGRTAADIERELEQARRAKE
jgi:hypothetical protein